VVKGVGDSPIGFREADRSPQLTGYLDHEERSGWYELGIERSEVAQGGIVVGMREADREADAVVQRGAAVGAGPTRPPFDELL
jgi:hypothetical protein